VLYQGVFALRPPNADPLFAVPDEYAYNTSDSPCGPGLKMLDGPEIGRHRRHTGEGENGQREDQHRQHRHLHFERLVKRHKEFVKTRIAAGSAG